MTIDMRCACNSCEVYCGRSILIIDPEQSNPIQDMQSSPLLLLGFLAMFAASATSMPQQDNNVDNDNIDNNDNNDNNVNDETINNTDNSDQNHILAKRQAPCPRHCCRSCQLGSELLCRSPTYNMVPCYDSDCSGCSVNKWCKKGCS